MTLHYMTPVLEREVEAAYARYATAPPTHLAVCTHCCMPPDVERAILALPPRQITNDQMQEWFSAAAQDPMPAEICTFLAPRVLDGLARQEALSDIGIEITLKRFAGVLAGDAFFADFAKMLLQAQIFYGDVPVDDLLCMFVLAGVDMTALVHDLAAMPDAVLVDRLWRDWCGSSSAPYIRRTAFWPKGQSADAFYKADALMTKIDAVIVAEDTSEELLLRAIAVQDVLSMAD